MTIQNNLLCLKGEHVKRGTNRKKEKHPKPARPIPADPKLSTKECDKE